MSVTAKVTSDPRGFKRICMSCGSRFYDMNKRPIVCPSCQTEFTGEIKVKSRRGRVAVSASEGQVDKKTAKDASNDSDDDNDDDVEEAEIVSLDDVQSAENKDNDDDDDGIDLDSLDDDDDSDIDDDLSGLEGDVDLDIDDDDKS